MPVQLFLYLPLSLSLARSLALSQAPLSLPLRRNTLAAHRTRRALGESLQRYFPDRNPPPPMTLP